MPEDAGWADLTYSEQLQICEMPEELLEDYTTADLGALVLEYPFLGDVLAFDSAERAIRHLGNSSNICREFFSRDDSTAVLLQEYSNLTVNYDALCNYSANSAEAVSGWRIGYVKELFLQTYFASIADTLSSAEKQLLKGAIARNYELKKGKIDDYSTALLIFDWLQAEDGEVAAELLPDSIYADNPSRFANLGKESVRICHNR
ncbi:MAG: hypothetical protein LBC21_06095 [Oscillospiraceae bacterium]|jgi:hypothetical protein|nr:hypothetical protein [Oscillospiraceae bacterium]